ncbi:unnamed protein product [Notodromas monacha]|uniref:Aconitase/3-isopropylmalate dehydratase large subunit alpha/beta/alpha domain-containing protein n=1 Tax=Notodromas monacha TaxID=399045 RepID=A0A7R9BVF6_9CRUS|nr:unnamed protein product [Notodromas monacha]CAG0921416.1 unnamed protein product [Notodromas monacha]
MTFEKILVELTIDGQNWRFFYLPALNDKRYGFDVPAVVDFAAMRDAVAGLGGDPTKINPCCPMDLVIDHSIQVDFARAPDSLSKNEEIEYRKNKWGAKALKNLTIVLPGSGIVHQANLEFLARVVFDNEEDCLLYCNSLVGTDSHTTMINGLGVLGWGVGDCLSHVRSWDRFWHRLLMLAALKPLQTTSLRNTPYLENFRMTFEKILAELTIDGQNWRFFYLPALNDERYEKLPLSIRMLLESAICTLDGFQVKEKDVQNILDWEKLHTDPDGVEIPFRPARWGAKALKNLTIVLSGSGILHQANLEFLARVVFDNEEDCLLYCNLLVGTDSHTTMINGLGVLGWGVGGNYLFLRSKQEPGSEFDDLKGGAAFGSILTGVLKVGMEMEV